MKVTNYPKYRAQMRRAPGNMALSRSNNNMAIMKMSKIIIARSMACARLACSESRGWRRTSYLRWHVGAARREMRVADSAEKPDDAIMAGSRAVCARFFAVASLLHHRKYMAKASRRWWPLAAHVASAYFLLGVAFRLIMRERRRQNRRIRRKEHRAATAEVKSKAHDAEGERLGHYSEPTAATTMSV